MNKVVVLTTGFSLLALTCASAEIYRCRTPEGKLVMTDQQLKLPANCQPIDEPTEAGSFNIMPRAKGIASEGQSAKPVQRTKTSTSTFASLQDQAQVLVQSYKEASAKRYGSGLAVERRSVIREIAELREQKQEMLGGLTSSGLTRNQQQSIKDVLEGIPQQ